MKLSKEEVQEIIKRIEIELGKRGISKQEFYKKSGVTSAAYSQWNTGSTTPQLKTLGRVANFLNMDLELLLTGKEKAPTENDGRVTDDDIKFALFGGDGEITDAMYEEVKQFAQMVKMREDAKKKG